MKTKKNDIYIYMYRYAYLLDKDLQKIHADIDIYLSCTSLHSYTQGNSAHALL